MSRNESRFGGFNEEERPTDERPMGTIEKT